MKKAKKNNRMDSINNEASNLVEQWLVLMSRQQLDLANTLCSIFIEKNKKILKKLLYRNLRHDYNKLYLLLILFKCMQDYTELHKITQDKLWLKKSEKIEKVWIKKCDCKDRLEFISDNFEGVVIEKILDGINRVENFFRKVFGNGLYLSPGLVADKFICNICQKDTRACLHIAGRLYKGRICNVSPINEVCNHVALVQEPKDYRCRIWPWNTDNEEKAMLIEAPVLTTFSVDDFLREE
jgi:hypothetical protein